MLPEGGKWQDLLEEAFGPAPGPVRRAWAPYRLSPLGAHTDHQLGLTCGFTLDFGISLVFRPRSDSVVRLRSKDFEGEATFDLGAVPPPLHDWGDYARGIAREVRTRQAVTRGLDGIVSGDLKPGGISTSAALQVAVLLALAGANDLAIPRLDAMQLVVAAERTYAGVKVGLLDPAVILFGKPDALVVLDCQEGVPRAQRISRHMPPWEWILVDSGIPRDLRSSPYNQRVEECRAAARALGAPAESPVLRMVSPEIFRRERKRLDPVLARRADHYFSEHKRVKLGMTAISTGDLEGLGRLVTASGESLTSLFECGTPETRTLLEVLRKSPGVLGASYAGGGFGGMLQALARPGTGTSLGEAALGPYRKAWPGPGSKARVDVVGMGPGADVT